MVRGIIVLSVLCGMQSYILGMENQGRPPRETMYSSQASLPQGDTSTQPMGQEKPLKTGTVRREKKQVSPFDAAKNGDIENVKQFLNGNRDANAVNIIDPSKGTLIRCAVKGLHSALDNKELAKVPYYKTLFKLLITSGADITLYPSEKKGLSIVHLFQRRTYENVRKIFEDVAGQSVADLIQKKSSNILSTSCKDSLLHEHAALAAVQSAQVSADVPSSPVSTLYSDVSVFQPQEVNVQGPEVLSHSSRLSLANSPLAQSVNLGALLRSLQEEDSEPAEQRKAIAYSPISQAQDVQGVNIRNLLRPSQDNFLTRFRSLNEDDSGPSIVLPRSVVENIQAHRGAAQTVPDGISSQGHSQEENVSTGTSVLPTTSAPDSVPVVHDEPSNVASHQTTEEPKVAIPTKTNKNGFSFNKKHGAAMLGLGFAGVVFYKWIKQVQARARQKPVHTAL